MPTLSAVAALRAELWDAGYRPVAIYNHDLDWLEAQYRGKRPRGKEWEIRARRDPPDDAESAPHPDALNTGILADGLRAIDIDIDNPTIAQRIKSLALDRFGEAPIRYRDNSARTLLLYRAAEGEPGKRTVSSSLGKVEILGKGQQFVAFGTHHTGATLHWMPEAPGTIAADSLPAVTEDAIHAFLEAAADILGAVKPAAASAGAMASPHGLGADALQVVAAVTAIPNDGPPDWESWNRIGMAIWAATSGSAAGLAAWHAWSQQNAAYDAAAADERWSHYSVSPPSRIGAGTLFHLARQARPVEDPPAPQAAAAPSPPKPLLWSIIQSWQEADIPKRPWIAKGYLMRGSVTVISGPGSAGKSSLMVAWCCALALGQRYSRFKPLNRDGECIPLRVATYNVEDDENEQKRRFSAALRQFDRNPADLMPNLAVLGPNTIGTLIQTRPDGEILVNTPVMDHLESFCDEFQPDVLILDPFVELHNIEENDNTAIRGVMARFRHMAEIRKIALVILHHTRKGLAAPGDPDMIRGAGSIVGAARVALTLFTMSEDDAKTLGIAPDQRRNFFRLDGAKLNYDRIRDAEWFERVEYTLDNEEDVAAAVPWAPPSVAVTTDLIETLIAAIAAGQHGVPWSPKLSDEPRSMRHLLNAHGISAPRAQKETLTSLYDKGCSVADFWHGRTPAKGMRAPDGRPAIRWKETQDYSQD